MSRLVIGLVIGLLAGIILTIVSVEGLRRPPQPTSQVVNQPTKAREIRVLKPGFDPDQRRFKVEREKH